MKVSEIMSRHVRVATPDLSIQEAARMMADMDSGVVPVGDSDQLVGMITDRDIAVRAVAEGRPHDTPVRDVMSTDVCYCFQDDDVETVARSMADMKVRRLPVVDRHKRLVGIVSFGDVSRGVNSDVAGQTLASVSRPGGPHSTRH